MDVALGGIRSVDGSDKPSIMSEPLITPVQKKARSKGEEDRAKRVKRGET